MPRHRRDVPWRPDATSSWSTSEGPERPSRRSLVLAGQFDPNARPADSRRVAEMMGGHARWVEFMGMGHSVRAFSPCAAGIVAAFIDKPEQLLDTSCAVQAPSIHYLPSQPAR